MGNRDLNVSEVLSVAVVVTKHAEGLSDLGSKKATIRKNEMLLRMQKIM